MPTPIQSIHLIAQYLAAAAISFLEPKKDDSHTNLGFVRQASRLETHPLNSAGIKLCFSYADFSLLWMGEGLEVICELDGKTHAQVLDWLTESAQGLGFGKPYKYNFHYELPYSWVKDEKLSSPCSAALNQHINQRRAAQIASEAFATYLGKQVPVRVWPHHFDTGAYLTLDSGLGVGWGMAIPDEVKAQMYFYLSCYKDGQSFLPEDVPELNQGHWHRDGFTGGVLILEDSQTDGFSFFKEALELIIGN